MRRYHHFGKMGADRGSLYRQVPAKVLRDIRNRRQDRDRLRREPGTRSLDDDNAGLCTSQLFPQQERYRIVAHAARHSLFR